MALRAMKSLRGRWRKTTFVEIAYGMTQNSATGKDTRYYLIYQP
jgi:hypothetical protein